MHRTSLLLSPNLTSLVDRVDEIEVIRTWLTVGDARLITLTGPAGVGKTRLALAAATDAYVVDRFPDGVTLINLAPIRAPEDVLIAIGRAFGFRDAGHVLLGERLVAYLQERKALLVLDNFEQVLPAAASMAELLAACPHLALLVTSRAPLDVRAEHTLRIAPLAVPDLRRALPPLAELSAMPSVALFLQRARARRADFALTEKQAPLVAQLVTHLDGLPLALELAAARLDALSLPAIVHRLGDHLQFLQWDATDLPARQRSLEAAVGWSYDLLSAPEQQLFRCLGVFLGRVTLDAITAAANAVEAREAAASDGAVREERATEYTLRRLLSLVEKSLILPARPEEPGEPVASATELEEWEDDEPAFGMLETVREYAWERLAAAGELEAVRRAHAHYFLALAERAEPLLRSHDQRTWYLRLEQEHDNLRAALRWLIDQDDETERGAALRLAAALGYFWWMRGHHTDGRHWLEEALARAPQETDPAVRIRALLVAGVFHRVQGEVARARVELEEALALAERRQDLAAVAQAHTDLGVRAVLAGELVEGMQQLREALRRWEGLGDPHGLGLTLFSLGFAADAAGDVAASPAHYTASLEWLDIAGDAQLAGLVHCYLAVLRWKRGELPGAVAHVRAALRTSIALRDRYLLRIGSQAAAMISEHADVPRRARLLGAADMLGWATGATLGVWKHLPEEWSAAGLRERLAREETGEERELTAAYRAGQLLAFGEVVAQALTLLDEVAAAFPQNPPSAATQASAPPALTPRAPSSGENPLTAREQEVLRLVADGLSSKLTARQLGIAPSTVNYHLATIFNKLGVDTRAQAVAVATRRDLL